MNQLRMKETGLVLSEYDYKALHPQVSFPPDFVPDDADRVVQVAPPTTTIYEQAVRAGVEMVDGVWSEKWLTAPATPPESISMLQARLALIDKGLLSAVDTYLTEMVGVEGEQARAFFEFAQSVRRDHPLVELLRTVLNLTPSEVDNMFILAAISG